MVGIATFVVATAACADDSRPGTTAIVLQVQQRTFDQLSETDIRPQSRGEVGGRLELSYQFTTHWAESASGHIGGSWFDFNGPGTVSGNIEDLSWSGRLGVDRLIHFDRGAAAMFGLGVEYGEARSWTKTFTFSETGPHSYFTGGSLRVGAVGPLWQRFQLCGELTQSVHNAHARDAVTALSYNWLSRSLAGSVGVRYVLLRGRPS